MSKNEIKKIGGEKETAILKGKAGKSSSNLYIDPKSGNIYSVKNGKNYGNLVGNIKDYIGG